MLLLVQDAKASKLVELVFGSLAQGETWIKLGVLLALAPIWFPILRTMFHEVQAALRHEGGLFGRTPTEMELRRLEERHGVYTSGLVSEPKPSYRPRPARAGAARSGGAAGGRGPLRATRGRGF